jgi:GNAT superfamily N-acetyltransferase
MQISDLPTALAVRLSTVENAITMEELESDYGITPQSLSEAMTSHVKGWLCEADGREASEIVVGFAMGDRSNGEVQVVAVLPEYEGMGIGKSLLTRVQTWLFSEGHEEIWLLANPDPNIRAHTFYRKLGWRATGSLRKDDEVMKLRRTESAFGR